MNQRDLQTVESIARSAGVVVMEHFGALALQSMEKKGARDLVTAADKASERLIVERIRELFPGDEILAEESAGDPSLIKGNSAQRLWIIDPIDGTTNFVHRIPHFAVSIALVVNGEPELACVYNPKLDECFTAARGQGAKLNGRLLTATATDSLGDAVMATGFHYQREFLPDSNLQHFVDFTYQVRGMRRLGSAALDLSYLADARIDGYWELQLSPWDVAGGALIAKEAGCLVTDFEGGNSWLFGKQIVAANPRLHPVILEKLRAADPAALPGPRFGEAKRA